MSTNSPFPKNDSDVSLSTAVQQITPPSTIDTSGTGNHNADGNPRRTVARRGSIRSTSSCASAQQQRRSIESTIESEIATRMPAEVGRSVEWETLIKPFVSDLTFRSLTRRRAESEICFQPYTCEAALLFVDLSGYSKINAALAAKGAHALSLAVNEYFERLIAIIVQYGGDVVKFAGDLVFVVWEGEVGDDEDLEYNLLCACQCALDLQRYAGAHPVKGTDLQFRIHCGLTIGILESEVFAAPSHVHMQRLYHSVSGQCLLEISELVDLAQAGEIAISQDVADFLGEMAIYDVDEDLIGAYMLLDLHIGQSTLEAVEQHVIDSIAERAARRVSGMEEEFIHPKVLGFLKHGGNSPTQIAQMRNLVTLFIGMTCGGNSVNWLMEVQSILDKNRCPIVQLINDDKGVHIVAAVNLYEGVPDSSLLALTACRELIDKQLGCAIGVAMGPTFCGVTGARAACRWDITGAGPVRAARLMQYALAEDLQVVIDASLLSESIAATRMSLIKQPINVKGTESQILIYRLSGSNLYSIFRVLENQPTSISTPSVQKVRKSINTAMARCATVVTGGPGSGVTLVCQRAATLSDLVPFSHICDETAGMAQLARSIAIWFSYAKYDCVQQQAELVMEHMKSSRWSRAHDECVNLLDMAVQAGLRACFILRRLQFLDNFSLSIIRECLKGRTFIVNGKGKSIYRRSDSMSVSLATEDAGSRKTDHGARTRQRRRARDARMSGGSGGKIVFLGAHTTLYQHRGAQEIVNEITRSTSAFQIKVVEVSPYSVEAKKSAIKEACDIDVSDRWLRYNSESTGLCIDSLIARANGAITRLSERSENDSGTGEVISKELVLCVAEEHRDLCGFGKTVGTDVMKLTQSFDGLSPVMQLFLKVVAIASRRALFQVPKTVALGVTNDLAGKTEIDAHRSDTIMKELEEMYLLKHDLDQGFEMIVFPVPALADIILDVCTPVQVHTISNTLMYRLASMQYVNFKIPFMVAELHCVARNEEGLGEQEILDEYWEEGIKLFDAESADWDSEDREWWLERLSESMRYCGGDSFAVDSRITRRPSAFSPISMVPQVILLLKSYVGPVTFGPLGHTLSVISRNMFQAYGALARKDTEALLDLQMSTSTATERYFEEVKMLASFMTLEGEPLAPDEEERVCMLQQEHDALVFVSKGVNTTDELERQANSFLYGFVPKYILPRIERVRSVAKYALREKPNFLEAITTETLSTAFKKLQGKACWKDATEDALMTLATRNWRPPQVSEKLPHNYYRTVCRIRNAVLRQKGRIGADKCHAFQHDSTFDDVAAFIIACALLGDSGPEQKESPEEVPQHMGESSYIVPLKQLGSE